ncbi:DUF1540 domain-containing protein [uncultured Clostridium sp.]|uniref:DUF1540 domain-containing protein n=1 Tax=uncultured Clostridium sp. TaxID=59620 RepID=UPI0028E6D063|nr:DUF1540 domain-containing protein [uncultured Clostridium sp.]
MSCNKSIGCSVRPCKWHSGDENYCTLEQIKVGTHESTPKQKECTDCESFELS